MIDDLQGDRHSGVCGVLEFHLCWYTEGLEVSKHPANYSCTIRRLGTMAKDEGPSEESQVQLAHRP
jgi:hypothetical protein